MIVNLTLKRVATPAASKFPKFAELLNAVTCTLSSFIKLQIVNMFNINKYFVLKLSFKYKCPRILAFRYI
jgi:hypothetical protein